MLINSLGLKNFKCFEELDVKFAPITLLTGANSSGKSSLINAILAVMQTEDLPFYLSPNGKYIDMGNYEEIVHRHDVNRDIEIEIKPYISETNGNFPSIFNSIWANNELNGSTIPKQITFKLEGNNLIHENWTVEITRKSNLYKLSLKVSAYDTRFDRAVISVLERVESIKDYIEFNENRTELTLEKEFKDISEVLDLFSDQYFTFRYSLSNAFTDKRFNYVGSFRQPPERTYYQKTKAQSKINTDGLGYIDQIIEWEESNSEKSAELIEIIRDLGLFTHIRHTNMKGGRVELNVKVHPEADFSSLSDVGFGISQFLPVLVADLQLPANSCLAVSQPEIHLHPKIQAQFGNYLADQVKQGGKQYIVETHSEYLLNRVRLLLVTGKLKPKDVCVLYFENNGVKSTAHKIDFITDGSIKGAPESFFDTYGIDVMNIAMEAIK